ncbi:hypothetical protein P5G51_017305 [Virgibacillus sp. 179-BFC.A HS]|uniref:Regulatory protein RecX n=1 Tax=Tigheibacillus jepli TaxID=3035914 RepID=A0ABU5CKN9_9BACI|nr:hypothetical protein [Virgibacillus sp. 179-BFC.A HS]MDY0406876.1 hypothetical protein [Virgibacillus sp. 179-BFC.A HS]
MQKGFTAEVVNDVVVNCKNNKNDNDEWEALCMQGDKLLQKYARKYDGYELHRKVKEGLYRKGFDFTAIDQFLEERREKE